MDVRRELGRRIKRLREERGLSQEELAGRSDIHVTYLSGVENGKRNPSLLILYRLAEALEVSLSSLFADL